MSSRKFFSGLTPGMMTRPSNAQNRQQTNFYWPDERSSDQVSSRSHRMRNRSLSTASIISQSQASTDTEESRRRRNNDLQSRIEFYDMVDTTDTESVYNRKMDPTTHKKLETLKSKIEFYDYVEPKNYDDDDANSVIEVVKKKENQEVEASVAAEKTTNAQDEQDLAKNMSNLNIRKAPTQRNTNSQFADSFGSDSEDETYRYQQAYRKSSAQKFSRRPHLSQQQQQQLPQQRPRRYNSHYFDDFEDDGYERYYDEPNHHRRPRFPRTNGNRRRDFSPDDLSDEEFFDDRSYARRNMREYPSRSRVYSPEREFRSSSSRYGADYDNYHHHRRSMNKITNGYGSEFVNESRLKTPPRQQKVNEIESETKLNAATAARPPVKPVQRSMSINEARRRHHVNLKSNIFHNDHEYDQSVEQKKPLSVRDFAANNRVGVGLPDF
jgi:hypothetical protein